jgi:hypothetical protein
MTSITQGRFEAWLALDEAHRKHGDTVTLEAWRECFYDITALQGDAKRQAFRRAVAALARCGIVGVVRPFLFRMVVIPPSKTETEGAVSMRVAADQA